MNFNKKYLALFLVLNNFNPLFGMNRLGRISGTIGRTLTQVAKSGSRSWNSLHHGAMNNISSKDFSELIKSGEDVNAQDKYGRTPLHFATSWKRAGIVEILLDNGADANILDEDNNAALYYGQMQIPGLDHFCHTDSCKTRRQIKKLLKPVTDNKFWFNGHPFDLLRRAIYVDNKHLSNMILGKLLSSTDLDLNKRHINGSSDYTLLHQACMNGASSEILTALINAGADVNAQNKYGGSALHFAAHYRKLEAIKVLLASGANPNILDAHGHTPMYYLTKRKDNSEGVFRTFSNP